MKKLSLTLIAALCSYSAFSQLSLWNFNYQVSVPLGETSDFIGKSSFRGAAVEGRGMITDNISLGGWFSWEVFYEKLDKATYSREGIDINGVQVRYLNVIPLLVNGHYYFGDFSSVTPYAGLGTGAYKIEERREMGLVAVVENNWHFGFTPEFGAYIPVSPDMGLNVSARYNYALKSKDTINYSYLSLNLGLAFLGW